METMPAATIVDQKNKEFSLASNHCGKTLTIIKISTTTPNKAAVFQG
jgi:hypothetical protein